MTDEDADRTTKGKMMEIFVLARERESKRGKKRAVRRVFGHTRGLRRLLVNMYLSQQERPHNLGEFRLRCSFAYLHKPHQTLLHVGGEEG